jgi:cytidine deaminase
MSKNADPVAALFEAAKAAQATAYAPYSRFKVGAALRTPSGAVFSGGNVENAAYPEGVCAETSAISAMAQGGERRIDEICVVADGEGLCTPCGGCRQRIREFADTETVIHVAGPEGVRARFTLSELLPYSFGPDHLSGKKERSATDRAAASPITPHATAASTDR